MRLLARNTFLINRRLAAILFATACLNAQWPQFRGNHQLTGVSTSTVPKTLKLLWTYEAGEPVESSAAIADGVVYVGSGAGFLHAIDLATGKMRWKYKVSPEGIGESSPAVANGTVFVGDLAGVFHAVDASTGKPLWTYKTGSEILSRYENFGLGEAIVAREPFVGITRVKLQNLIQEYGDKLADQKIKP